MKYALGTRRKLQAMGELTHAVLILACSLRLVHVFLSSGALSYLDWIAPLVLLGSSYLPRPFFIAGGMVCMAFLMVARLMAGTAGLFVRALLTTGSWVLRPLLNPGASIGEAAAPCSGLRQLPSASPARIEAALADQVPAEGTIPHVSQHSGNGATGSRRQHPS